MSVPPDHIGFHLVSNDDGDSKRDAEATKAVKANIIFLAQEFGLKVHEDPGAIEPEAQENPQRAEKIEREVTPKLIDVTTAQYQKQESVEEYYPNGQLKRRAEKIVYARGKLSSSLQELHDLADKCAAGMNAVIEIACKVVNWVREKIQALRR